MQYDSNQATNAIHLWKAHLLRTILQEKAKEDILVNLDRASTLIIMDWAMKFRERMDVFFGKRGRSWHVTCAIKWKRLSTSLTHVYRTVSLSHQLQSTRSV